MGQVSPLSVFFLIFLLKFLIIITSGNEIGKYSNAENFYVLKIRLNIFEISKQVLKFEMFLTNILYNKLTSKNKYFLLLTCFENLSFDHFGPSFGPFLIFKKRFGGKVLDLRYVIL